MTAALLADLIVRRGSFVLDIELQLEPGEVVALLGPNGTGKSTLLGALAGLIRPASGRIAVFGRTITSRARSDSRDIAVPPERRSIGLLGQQALLFPHLSVLDNVAFGPEAQGVRRKDALREAHGWLEAVGLGGFAQRKPAALSGGEQQRVALARALAARPQVLLLDEPMAALDVQTASLIRELLRERLADSGIATIVVTHDVLDAIVLAERVVIMQDGRLVDDGPKERVLGLPRNQFIAALAGVNLVGGVADADGAVCLEDGRRFVGCGDSGRASVPGANVSAVFRPSAVKVWRGQPAAMGHVGTEPDGESMVNTWEATIAALEPSSGGIRIRTGGDAEIVAEVSPYEIAALGLAVGQRVWLSIDPAELSIHFR